MRIDFVTTEAVPFTKVGGLADVAGSLPVALAQHGHALRVIQPWYAGITPEPQRIGSVRFNFEGMPEEVGLGELMHGGVRFLFLGLGDFARRELYGHADDVRRTVRFDLAAAALIDADVVHAHDWQGGLVPLLARIGRVRASRTVFTIHNMHHQGAWGPQELLRWAGVGWEHFSIDGLEFHGAASLLKAGIVYSDRVTTVSPSYLEEIKRPGGGAGFEGVIQRHAHKVSAVLNGIDTEYWNPASDPHLAAHYSLGEMGGKAACKQDLVRRMGIAEGTTILGVISRFAYQKGIDLVLDAAQELVRLGFSFAILGSGDPHLERGWSDAQSRHPGRVALHTGFDEPLAHRIYAGADAILMPSRFEPCGLVQMIAQRYGTPPIARAVGGLKDTVQDAVNGYLFHTLHAEGLTAATLRFRLDPAPSAVIEAGMKLDHSWRERAEDYLRLYRSALGW